MNKDFIQVIKDRRTYYAIGKQSPISDDKIVEEVEYAVLHTPTAFNSQSGRAAVLLGSEHEALWNIVLEELRKVVPAEAFAATEERINSFRQGYGTVLFFEDQTVVEGLQAQFPLYKDNFPIWSQQASGMLQYIVWTLLEEDGLGVSLQHYNPLIDREVFKRWNLPQNWKLIGEMPFGSPLRDPEEKELLPIESRVKVFK
jgi:uncharacterized protein